MAYYLAVTIGYVVCLGMLGSAFIYYVSIGLKTSDSTKVDAIK